MGLSSNNTHFKHVESQGASEKPKLTASLLEVIVKLMSFLFYGGCFQHQVLACSKSRATTAGGKNVRIAADYSQAAAECSFQLRTGSETDSEEEVKSLVRLVEEIPGEAYRVRQYCHCRVEVFPFKPEMLQVRLGM